MFTFEQIKEFVELVGRHRLHALEIERSGFKLRITGEAPAAPEPIVASAPAQPAAPANIVASGEAVGPAPAAPAPPVSSGPSPGLHVVTSPIVGTFYSSPSPDSPVYTRVGDRVKKGQVLCIVEAMKLMNEIECDIDGTVAEIYPKNAQPVEYGEPLFGVRLD